MHNKRNICYSFIPSVYLKDNEEIITLSPEKIENAVINQLKDGKIVEALNLHLYI